MRGEVALAVRVAVGSDAAGRRRSAMVALAAAAGTGVAMVVLAFARADRVVHPERYTDGGIGRLVAVVIAVVGLQVAALAAAAGRLSAVVRARRLANLRLLGLTAARTRLVSAIEVGLFSGIGAAMGVGLFAAIRPALAKVAISGQRWPEHELHPGALASAIVTIVSVLMTIGLAVLPDRLGQAASPARVRRASTNAPTVWRLVPLVVGVGLCLCVQRTASDGMRVRTFIAGVLSLGTGVMLVLPIFVRLVAGVLERVARGPVLLVTARRLQAQPAGMSRVVTGLLIGLFVATGARSVVTAFEATPQYEGAAIGVLDHQSVALGAGAEEAAGMAQSISAVPGVRSATALPELTLTGCDPGTGQGCLSAVVATCDQFETVFPTAIGCVPDEVQWIRQFEQTPPDIDEGARWATQGGTGPSVPAEPVQSRIEIGSIEPFSRGNSVRIPPASPGIIKLASTASYTVNVIGEPGRDLPDRLRAAGFDGAFSSWDPAEYNFVATLRALANAVAALVLGLGLLAFAIAAIDRATDRRRDVTGLVLLGAPRSLLRRTQWIEAAVPIVGGGVLAVLLGLLAGAAYLAGSEGVAPPITTAMWLATAAALGGLMVAGLTVVAASPAIDAHNIRRE